MRELRLTRLSVEYDQRQRTPLSRTCARGQAHGGQDAVEDQGLRVLGRHLIGLAEHQEDGGAVLGLGVLQRAQDVLERRQVLQMLLCGRRHHNHAARGRESVWQPAVLQVRLKGIGANRLLAVSALKRFKQSQADTG